MGPQGPEGPPWPGVNVDPNDGDNVFYNISDIIPYLKATPGGYKPDNAIPIVLKVYLGNMAMPNSGWQRLLESIEEANKLVTLDLSDCGMIGAEFDPDYTIHIGKDKIVSLVLPDVAVGIKAGSDIDTKTFKHFSNLKTCAGGNIRQIGSFAFSNCPLLESVEFPVVQSIDESAFGDCILLESVEFPKASTIGERAFYYCQMLKTVKFPEVRYIERNIFSGCYALESVELPMAQYIGNYVFANTGDTALVISFGNNAPEVGLYIFRDVNTQKNVTVKVPVGAVGYDTSPTDASTFNWGNAFRGLSSNGGGTVNENINLVIETTSP